MERLPNRVQNAENSQAAIDSQDVELISSGNDEEVVVVHIRDFLVRIVSFLHQAD